MKKRFFLFLACLLLLSAAGCGERLGGQELFKLGDQVCTRQEALVFLMSQKQKYETAYGNGIWDVKVRDTTFADYMKDNLQDFLAKLKCMVLMAEQYEVVLTEEEEAAVARAAELYLAGISDEAEAAGIGYEDVEAAFRDYYTADKLMRHLTADVSGEISEDQARVIVVQQIFLSTEGLTEEEKTARWNEAAAVWQAAQSGADFAVLAGEFNEGEEFELRLARGESESSFEEAAFSLSSGQISGVVETQQGFHVIKCVSNYEEEETAENKKEIARQQKEDCFHEYYDRFVDTVAARYNEKAWDQIDYRENFGVPGTDFYEVYGQYFGTAG